MTRRRKINRDEVDGLMDRALDLALTWRERHPHSALPARLDSLFRQLARPAQTGELDPDEVEELIWALWISHPDPHPAAMMAAASEAISISAFDLAAPLLDDLVAAHPDWAEAWNKRAVVAYAEKRDRDCLTDIARTLALEPRHFGAISGLAQICARYGRYREAHAAFQVALAINPHLEGVPEVMAELGQAGPPLH